MFLVNAAMEDVSIGTAALIVVLGMAVVFFGLILLMYVTKIAGAIISRKKSAEPAAAPAAAPAAPAVKTAPAPGTAGKIALHDVPDKTAAMLMAIVASKTGKPLNQLRFISIREIKDGHHCYIGTRTVRARSLFCIKKTTGNAGGSKKL